MMVDKIFNALSSNNLSVQEKLQNIEQLLQLTLDGYTDDEGNIYTETIDAFLDEAAVQTMSLTELDDVVDEAAFGNDLVKSLLLLKKFAELDWGATSASVVHGDGFFLFEVKYGDESFKRIIDVEDDPYVGA